MSKQLQLDAVDGRAPNGAPIAIERGVPLRMVGWAADTSAAQTLTVAVRIGGAIECVATAIERPDVVAHFNDEALRFCGFSIEFPTHVLKYGRHTVLVGILDGDVFAPAHQLTVDCVPAREQGAAPGPRILIAAAPKSGSTYTWGVLKTYFGLADPPLHGINQLWEHNLDAWVTQRIERRAYVLQMHAKPYEQNLATIRRENMSTIVTWRNLADTLISYDDHIRREGECGTNFMLEMDDRVYLKMPDQARYRYLIRYAAPWYISFYTGWRKQTFPLLAHYELLASDPHVYFTNIVRHVAVDVDEARLASIIAAEMPDSHQRLNVGKNGRSVEKMDGETKAMLEELLTRHYENLDELRAELPWNDGRRFEPQAYAIAGQPLSR